MIKHVCELLEAAVDAGLLRVHRSDEAVPKIRHDFSKGKEYVTLEVLTVLPSGVPEAVVEGRQYLVHPLDVHDGRV